MIALIFAMDDTGLIGKGNSLPWHLPADLKHFKEKTVGNTVLMGRKTYESLKNPLKGRKNIIMSNTILNPGNKYFFEEKDENTSIIVTRDMDIVYKFAKAGDVFVIGGADIFKQFIPIADTIYMTQIHGQFEGDTYFPIELIDYREWTETETVYREKDFDKNPYDMTFRTLKRKS